MKRAKVYVTLKPTVLDPQGATVAKALNHLGYQEVSNARVGKIIELEVDDKTPKARIEEMAERLLANPVIEEFVVEIEE